MIYWWSWDYNTAGLRFLHEIIRRYQYLLVPGLDKVLCHMEHVFPP